MISEKDFITSNFQLLQQASFECSAPSNIALIKYWGKKENQIPANPSISFTLNHCKTITKVNFTPKKIDTNLSFDFLFEGNPKEDFKPKILKFLELITVYCPYLKHYHLSIDTQNTFPHSSGIASSASGMAALALNIMCLEKQINPSITDDFFYKKASFLARLGSGSACRSIKGAVVTWGTNDSFVDSSDFFGVSFEELHNNFKNFQDTILLVDKGEKKVSSSVGHNLMVNHPFAENRFKQAHENLAKITKILKEGDLISFIQLVESEALTLHAMMMTSVPYFILMKPNTLEIINKIWSFRKESFVPVCFTLDAGANVHVLYPDDYKEKVLQFIKSELAVYCENGQYICDYVGQGATQLK
ncbi:MAG TPA: diphosphomevalonate decarboxylase [Flavobacterium sp.]|nr:diphosphomevalonate decarboxylase [Flavobacterium sp.]